MTVRPEIYVKGGDYDMSVIPKAQPSRSGAAASGSSSSINAPPRLLARIRGPR